MSKKYNIGVIGYGWVATAHIPALNATKQGKCQDRLYVKATALSANA